MKHRQLFRGALLAACLGGYPSHAGLAKNICSHLVNSLYDHVFNARNLGVAALYSRAIVAARIGHLPKMANFLRGIVELHSIYDPGGKETMHFHSTKISDLMKESDFMSRVEKFSARLQQLCSERSHPSDSLWELALQVNSRDANRAIDFLMVFVQDAQNSDWNFIGQLRKNGVEDASEKWDRIQSVRSTILGATDHFLPGYFAGPDWDGPPVEYNQFYHFWSAAYVARTLVRRGYEPNIASMLAVLVGDAYEKASIPRFWFEANAPDASRSIAHPLNHIAQHIRGALWGAHLNFEQLPSHNETVTFVKKNFWSNYRALAFGEFAGGKDPSPEHKLTRVLRNLNRDKYALLLASLFIRNEVSIHYCHCVEVGGQYLLRARTRRRSNPVTPGSTLGYFETFEACEEKRASHAACQ